MKHLAHPAAGLILATLLVIGCAPDSNEIRLADIVIKGTSTQETVEYLYFRVPAGVHCPGVRIREEGRRQTITFMQGTPGVDLSVDSKAVVTTEAPWAGNLRVEIPIDHELLEKGGEVTIFLEGRGKSRQLEVNTYPARKPVETRTAPAPKSPGH